MEARNLEIVEPIQEVQHEIKLVQITNPMWIGQIGPQIDAMVKRIAIDGIQYETMFSYFQHSIASGGTATQFYVALVDGEPGAFAHWHLRAFPYIAHAYLDFMYNWSKVSEATEKLIEQCFEFAKSNRCNFISADVLSRAHYRLFNKILKRLGCTNGEREYTHVTARRG